MRVVTRYWKLLIGALLAVTGAVTVLIAWFQVRDLLEVADQVPVLISGGIGGLLLVLGGLWLLRSRENDLLMSHLRENAVRLDRLEDDVAKLTAMLDVAVVDTVPAPAEIWS